MWVCGQLVSLRTLAENSPTRFPKISEGVFRKLPNRAEWHFDSDASSAAVSGREFLVRRDNLGKPWTVLDLLAVGVSSRCFFQNWKPNRSLILQPGNDFWSG